MAKTRGQERGLIPVDKGPFIFYANSQCLELADTLLLLGVSDEDQVISTKKLQRHNNDELTQKRLQDEEKSAQQRAPM